MEKGMEQSLREQVERLLKNRIRVGFAPPEGELPPGCSRFGGKPCLPEGFEWPWYHGKKLEYSDRKFTTVSADCPLAFLCQIDLAEAAAYDRDGLLPKSGLLSFFYEVDSQPWGYAPDHRGGARVYYFPEGTALRETDFPRELPDCCQMPELAVTLEAAPGLPDWDDLELLAPGLQERLDDDYDRYDQLKRELGCAGEYGSHLLGYPDLIQNPMALECEQVARGYDCGRGPAGIPPKKQAEIAAAAGDWVLLFQMGTVGDGKDFELMYGDCGCIYFWIRRQDLAAGDLDRVWLILQCG